MKLFKKDQNVILKNDVLEDVVYATVIFAQNDEECKVKLNTYICAKTLKPIVGTKTTKEIMGISMT